MPAAITAIVSAARKLPFIRLSYESKTRYENFAFEGCPETRVAASVKKQRRGTRRPVQHQHPAHDNPVIPAVMDRVYRAADGRRATVQPWAAFPLEECKFRRQWTRPAAREIRGEVLLLSVEDVDGEAVHRVNDLARFRRLAHAEQDQRRVERDRGKRVGGQRPDYAVDLGRDDRHARCELPDSLAEGTRIDHAVTPRFLITALTSLGLIRSGTVQPFKSYSAMHCSANPLYLALAPVRSATISVSKRMLSWLPK